MSLNTAEGYILASELLSIAMIPKRLASMPASTSDVPDFVSIGINSIKQLTTKFGKDSIQVREALRLLDAALVQMQAELAVMYNGDMTTEIIGLSESTVEHTFYTQGKQLQTMHKATEFNSSASPAPVATGGYSPDAITAFQTQLWVAVVLIIVVILVVITLVKMDKLETSLIYRTTDGPRPIQDVQ